MKSVITYVVLLFVISFSIHGCRSTQIDTVKAAEEKRLNTLLDSVAAAQAAEALCDMDFVINGDRITISSHTFNCDDRSTNFIYVTGGKVTLQLASMRGMSGLNGIGGITLEGNVSGTKIQQDKKGNLMVTFNALGNAMMANYIVMLPKGSCYANVSVHSNHPGRNFTLYGTLSRFDAYKIFEGSKR